MTYEITDEMFEAFWSGAWIASLFLMGLVAWVLCARLINGSLD